MNINKTNNISFNAKFEMSAALVELMGKIPLEKREEAYKLLSEPKTVNQIRSVKVDGFEPTVKVMYDSGIATLENRFKLKLSLNKMNIYKAFKLEEATPEKLVNTLVETIYDASVKLQDSFDYIKMKTSKVINIINS